MEDYKYQQNSWDFFCRLKFNIEEYRFACKMFNVDRMPRKIQNHVRK